MCGDCVEFGLVVNLKLEENSKYKLKDQTSKEMATADKFKWVWAFCT